GIDQRLAVGAEPRDEGVRIAASMRLEGVLGWEVLRRGAAGHVDVGNGEIGTERDRVGSREAGAAEIGRKDWLLRVGVQMEDEGCRVIDLIPVLKGTPDREVVRAGGAGDKGLAVAVEGDAGAPIHARIAAIALMGT